MHNNSSGAECRLKHHPWGVQRQGSNYSWRRHNAMVNKDVCTSAIAGILFAHLTVLSSAILPQTFRMLQLPGTTERLSSHHLFSISCLFCPWHSRWFWSLGSLVLVLILTEYKEQLQKKGRLKVENWEQFAYFFSFKRTIYDSIIAKLLQKSCFVFASAHWDTI